MAAKASRKVATKAEGKVGTTGGTVAIEGLGHGMWHDHQERVHHRHGGRLRRHGGRDGQHGWLRCHHGWLHGHHTRLHDHLG